MRRSRAIALGALGLVLLLLLFLLGRSASRRPARPATPAAERAAGPGAGPGGGAMAAEEPPVLPDELNKPVAAVIGEPMIDGVEIWPTRVCMGSPMIVNVSAHDADGADHELTYEIGSEPGNPVVLMPSHVGKVVLLVKTSSPSGNYDQRPVEVEVDDCGVDSEPMHLTAAEAGEVGVVGIRAVLPHRATGKRAWTYTWDFGDGTSETSTKGYVEHDYRRRPQRSITSSFVVRAVAKAGDLEVAGIVGVSLVNLNVLNRKKGHLVLQVIPTGKSLGKDGLRLDMDVINDSSQTARLREYKGQAIGCSGDGKDTRDLSLTASMFSPTTLPPGVTHFTARLPGELVQGSCFVQFDLGAEPIDKLQVSMVFGEQIAPLAQARLVDNKSTEGAAEMERVKLAAKLLGRDLHSGDTVTTDEIDRLVREGRLPPPAPMAGVSGH